MNKKIILIIASSLIIGLVIGVMGSFIFVGNTAKNTMQILGLQCRAEWEERAYQAYKNEDSKVAIWALKNLVEILQEHAEIYINDKESIQKDFVLTYTRLANLYKTQNDDIRYKENILKALNIANVAYKDIKTEEDLLNFLKRIDKK